MQDEDALEMIREALCQVAPERAQQFQKLTLDSEVKSLGIDSILTLEMIGNLEDGLARTFEEHELAKVNKLSDLAALIRRE